MLIIERQTRAEKNICGDNVGENDRIDPVGKNTQSDKINVRREKLQKFYKSKAWIKVRDYCMMRDKYLCRICHDRPAEVVHHIEHLTEDNVDRWEIALNPDNLISICAACHFEEHRGTHARGRVNEENYPYTFDRNGMLIPKGKS